MNEQAPSIAAADSRLRLREATAADRPRLIPMINAAFSIEQFLDGTRTDEARLAATMEKGTILMAEDGAGRLLGSVYVELRGGIEFRGERGYMGMLAVDPAEQGKGLARKLMLAAEERFRAHGCNAVEIVVLNLRPELLPIYRRFGFVETEAIDFQTSRPLKPGVECHGIVMVKQL